MATKAPQYASGQRGFSLAEILVTLGIAAVLAAYAIPNLSGFLRNVKLNALSGSLASSLKLARSEAIKLNRPVLVCRTNSAGSACSTASATEWGSRGWLVCFAQFSANVCEASTADLPNPILVQTAIDTTFAGLEGPATVVRFDPSGSQSAGAATITFTITGTWSGATPLTVTVAPSGLVKGSRV